MAEGGGLLNRYRVVKPYRGFESLRLRQNHLYRADFAGVYAWSLSVRTIGCTIRFRRHEHHRSDRFDRRHGYRFIASKAQSLKAKELAHTEQGKYF